MTDIAGTGNQNRSKDLGYDDLDRLIVADAPNQWGQATYAYDPMDNLRSADQGSRQYRYTYSTITNRLTDIKTPGGATVFGFTYDARGNTSSKGAQAYTFDSANRLSQVNNLETYVYDGQGRRVRTTDQGGAINYWIYSQGGQVMYAKLGRSGKWLNYIYLGNTQVAVRSVDNATSVVSVAYQHTDSLGSPVVETTSARVPTRHSYAPYGEAYGEPAGGSVDGTGYTGHVMDRATGLTYMQQRYYDPMIGRFLSVDPVSSDPKSGVNFNRYWYANNSPYRFLDRDGRQATYVLFDMTDKNINTIVADGKGGLKVHLGDTKGMGPVVLNGVTKHEMGHIDEFPTQCGSTCGILSEAKEGQGVGILEPDKRAESEVRATDIELDYLNGEKDKLKNAKEKSDIEARIEQMTDYKMQNKEVVDSTPKPESKEKPEEPKPATIKETN